MRVISEPNVDLKSVVVVRPEGHLDAVGASQFWDTVSPKLTEATPSLMVNMCKVDFMSSAGVGILIRLLTRIGQLGGVMTVCGCHHRVMTVLHVVHLEEVLNVCMDRRRVAVADVVCRPVGFFQQGHRP